jgi:hypothetical protein
MDCAIDDNWLGVLYQGRNTLLHNFVPWGAMR